MTRRKQDAGDPGRGWQLGASSLLVGLTLVVILLFFLQQLTELSW